MDLMVCEDAQLGDSCSNRAVAPSAVKCFAASANSIGVEWEAAFHANEDGHHDSLLSEYRVTAFAQDEQVVATVNSSAKTQVTFKLGLKHNLVYSVQVEALYDKGTIKSNAAMCTISQDGLPCIPPIRTPAASESNAVSLVQRKQRRRRLNSKGAASCPCLKSAKVFDILQTSGYIDTNGAIKSTGVPQPLWPADRNGRDGGAVYGGGSCMKHDQHLPPVCADGMGRPLVDAPEWCSRSWCYVDTANCGLGNTLSRDFATAALAYSYDTCGFMDAYSAVCSCDPAVEFHTKGYPSPGNDPPLQPDVSMGPARDWKCEACPEGCQCTGGTAATVTVRPGYFVIRRVSKATGAEKRPKLWRCPGGSVECPGGASITAALGVLLPTERTAATACESIPNSTTGTGSVGFDTARLLQHPQCQCGPGGTGMLCRACMSSSSAETMWVFDEKSGVGCHKCSLSSADSTKLVAAVTFGFLLVMFCVTLGWWRHTKPSITEQHFIHAFRHIGELGAARIAKEFFGVPSIGMGITKDVFVAAVILRCGGHRRGNKGTVSAIVKAHALKLWGKLDEDGDGKVTLDEVREQMAPPLPRPLSHNPHLLSIHEHGMFGRTLTSEKQF